jgi:LysR family glycine cleavage system transcriptional activator
VHNLHESNLSHLSDELFLHTAWGSSFASLPSWKDWFASAGIRRTPDIALGHQIGMSSVALEYARLDMGVLLGQRQLAAQDIMQDRLVLLSEQSLSLGHAYSAVHPHSRSRHVGLQELVGMLSEDVD